MSTLGKILGGGTSAEPSWQKSSVILHSLFLHHDLLHTGRIYPILRPVLCTLLTIEFAMSA